MLAHRRSWIENTNLSMKGSFTDLSNLDLDSVNSTPAIQRVSIIRTMFVICIIWAKHDGSYNVVIIWR